MSTITAILYPDADGTVHVPLPEGLRRGKLRVTATVQSLEGKGQTQEERRHELRDALAQLRASGAFKEITDPVAWQREIRKDRSLPGRE